MLWRFSVAAVALLWSIVAHANSTKVVIGDIDDMSGPYADTNGPGAVEAIKMAIADFGGSVLGQRIELLTADHQNKPDIGAQKFREWADRDGLTMVMLGANTGVSLAMASMAKEKKIPFFAIGATGASLTGKDFIPTRSTTSTTQRRSASARRRRSSARAARPRFFLFSD